MGAPILLTGASGYIGSRLLHVLEESGVRVRCLARHPERIAPEHPSTEVVRGDCLDEASLDAAMTGVHQAYYLVHSMDSGPSFIDRDREAAANFGRAASRAGVRRIIYLGGLGAEHDSLSAHLQSRLETGVALRESGVPVIEFRASIVVGAGGLSFEIIRALVERLPMMICPKWVETCTQPIAIADVLTYLRAALDLPADRGGVFEIGGPEVVSYGDMMREYARLRGLRRLLIPVPVLTPRLSGLWLRLVTPAQARVGRALVAGLRNSTVVRSPAADETFDVRPMPLREAFERAIAEGRSAHLKIDSRLAVVDAPPPQTFAPIRCIGGATGWYFGEWLWRLRGWIDRGLGGVGMPRTRRDPQDCVAGDVIDGWRVDAYEPDRRLRLSAGLKLPGSGWLEFRVDPLDGGSRSLIRQTATFDPRGWAGRLYWYTVLPMHALIFRGLLRQVARRAMQGKVNADPSTFIYRSLIPAPAAQVFHWHEQPGALAALTPRIVRIDQQEGGIGDGGRVVISIGISKARLRWVLRHYGYIAGRQFCDEQVSGPFAEWRHVHRFQPVGSGQMLYEDRITFAVSGRAGVNAVAGAILRGLLRIAFAHRHRVVRAAVTRGRAGVRRRSAVAAALARAMLVTAMLTAATATAATPTAAAPSEVSAQDPSLPPVRTVPMVHLARYAGDWFEIARFPNRFQRKCVGDVRASYSRRADGRLDVVNRCRTDGGQTEARGIARIVDDRTFARLEVRFAPGWLSFLPAVWGDYWVIGLAPDYSWAVVGEPGRDYLWILARSRSLDDQSLAAARAVARDNGFDVNRLVPTTQRDPGSR